MLFLKTIKSKHTLFSTLILMLTLLFMAACGKSGHTQSTGSLEADGDFSTAIPLALEKIPVGSTFSAELSIDGGAPIFMTVSGETVSVTTPELSAGSHTFTITYFMDGKRIALAETSATIVAGQSTPIIFELAQLDQDLDKDGVSGIDEVIAGSDPDDATSKPNQAPTAAINTPATNLAILPGQSVNFSATATDPDNNTPFTFLWDFGGGATNSTAEDPGAVIFNTLGTFTVTLTVTDSTGLSDPTPETRSITVNANQAPNGVINTPATDLAILPGQSVNFTGTGSSSDGNTPLTFLWDFGGGATNSTAEDPGAVTFNTPGTFTISFTVTDSTGLSDPTPETRSITVNANQAPNGVINSPLGDQTILTGESINFAGTGSDPDGNTPLTFLWDFGGGATNSTAQDPGPVTFNGPGIYTVTLTVRDSLNLSDPTPATRIVRVNSTSLGFAYVANQGSNTLRAYTINAASGALTRIGTTDIATGSGPRSVTVDPSGKFAYVANADSDTVRAYTINAASGTLTRIGTTDVAAGSIPLSVTVDPSGKFAYIANAGSDTVRAYTINVASGTLTRIGTTDVAAGSSPRSVTVDPSGKFAYVANAGADTVRAYTINAASGALTRIGTTDVVTGSFPLSVTVDPFGKFAYVANSDSGTVRAYTINAASGALTRIGTTDVATGTFPNSVTVDPSGKFAYVAAGLFSDTVRAYTINAASGALTRIGTTDIAAGDGTNSVTVDPSGKFAYVANFSSKTVTAYTINAVSGALTRIGTTDVATGASPISIVTTAIQGSNF